MTAFTRFGLPLMMIGLLGATPVWATGGLNCAIDDDNLTAEYDAGFSYSVPGPMFGVQGQLSVKNAELPKELQSIPVTGKMLAQQWFDGPDLRLQLYKETEAEPFSLVDLKILATQDPEDETSYPGTYELKVQLPGKPSDDGVANIVRKTGKVACSAG